MLRYSATKSNSRPGLSLLEVLLASVIFMMVLAGITILIRSAVDNALSAYRTNLGSSLARSKMAEVEAGLGGIKRQSHGRHAHGRARPA